MIFELYRDEVLHDGKVTFGVFSKTIAKIDSIYSQIVEIKEDGYTFRNGKMIEGKELNKILHDLEEKYKFLQELVVDAEPYKNDTQF
ncbi:hypothetical protein OD350_28870 (plasmid) [Clostridium beijerinckii]|uniref:hypothetical protein n=1 Tax=Clostridium beijerinckii TaxID=1520 RepID=UPI002227EC23|nr:hypothetical protein [Clostridium beijerinckii]UYZ39088.1 hypothetical protein OD350_28870 [Clostridium beijerinckii]